MPTEENMIDKKLAVPYHSQYLVPDFEWNVRACGAASLKELLESRGVVVPDLLTFTLQAKKFGAYSPNGWVHDKLIEFAATYGVSMFRQEKMEEELGIATIAQHILNDKPVIASVVKRYLDTTKFHMVLITGVRMQKSGEVVGFYYHDPEWFTPEQGAHRFTTREQFLESWRRMALFIV